MINPLDAYREAGEKAGRAQKQRLAADYDFHRRWFNKARDLEKPENLAAVKAAWDEGYKLGNPAPTVAYFR